MSQPALENELDTVPAPEVVRPGELTAHRASLPALTGIRFLAAMYIVFYHSKLSGFLTTHGLTPAGNIIANGQLAVLLFFVLSGFILSYTYEGQIERWPQKRRFWEARVARIWPLYLFSLLCSSLANHTTPRLSYAVATLFMVQAWSPTNVGMAASWNFVCWTLSTEVLFYLIFPPVQAWLERRSSVVQASALAVAMSIGIAFATGSISYSDTHGIRHIPLAVLHIPDFLIGVCLGNLYLRRRAAARREGLTGPLLPGRGLFTWLAILSSFYLLSHLGSRYTTWTEATFAAIIFGLAIERSWAQRFLASHALRIGGQISYGIYLLQWPCKAVVNLLCTHLHIMSSNARTFIDCVALILLSTATFYGIEEPARRLIRSGFSRLERRRA